MKAFAITPAGRPVGRRAFGRTEWIARSSDLPTGLPVGTQWRPSCQRPSCRNGSEGRHV